MANNVEKQIMGHKKNNAVFTVSEFLEFINEILRIRKVAVKGEVGEKIGKYPSGVYFNLIDKQEAVLKCFVPAWMNRNIGVDLKPGTEILVIGYPTVWRKSGDFKFNVDRVELVGEGALKKQFEFLKAQLATAGYFNEDAKKPLPRFIEKVGLITSQFGRGAKKDFLTRLGEFGFSVHFYDVRVEGHSALEEITGAIEWFNQSAEKMDVLVITRGGGDWESLKAFNSEEMVKAIFSSKIPIITGIGHEDDETLADLVSDVRASTPTHAAKIITENWEAAKNAAPELERNISKLSSQVVVRQTESLMALKQSLDVAFKNYSDRFNFAARELTNNANRIKILIGRELEINNLLARRITEGVIGWLAQIGNRLKVDGEKLQLSSPVIRLKQGYAVVTDNKGKVIKDASRLLVGQEIITKYHIGQTSSEIKKITNL